MLKAAVQFLRRSVCRRRIERRLARCLARAKAPIDGLRVVAGSTDHARHYLGLRKDSQKLVVTVNCGAISKLGLTGVFCSRSPAIIDPFLRSRASEAVGDVSDGEEGGPGRISFSSADPASILVPDSEFHRSRGYDSYRAAASAWHVDWTGRKDEIVWRGSTTGRGQLSTVEMAAGDTKLIQRTRMCLMLRTSSGVDARLVNAVQSLNPGEDRRRFEEAGIFGVYIDPSTWLIRKFAIDIDGNTNAWSNLFMRLLAGCCIIKVASPFGYRQWYYDALQPWQHFVPVKADLSDLHEKIDWCRTHDRQCAEIAAAGRDFAVRRDFETEMNVAVDTLNRQLHARAV